MFRGRAAQTYRECVRTCGKSRRGSFPPRSLLCLTLHPIRLCLPQSCFGFVALLPLLRKVDHPVAVDPDSALEREAREQGWPVISLR